jgi:hypothetical protein
LSAVIKPLLEAGAADVSRTRRIKIPDKRRFNMLTSISASRIKIPDKRRINE